MLLRLPGPRTERKRKEQQQDSSNLLKSKTPRGHRRVGPPFPANPWYKVSNFHHKILTLGEKREEEKEQGGVTGGAELLCSCVRGKKNWQPERKGVRGFF
jgi:hypothetical protein